MQNYYVKIVLIGDSSVGKSNILVRYHEKRFICNMPSTIGIEFIQKVVEVEGNKIHLAIWDTAGQERYRSLTRNFYRKASGAVLVYDVARTVTLNNLLYVWYPEFCEWTKNTKCILVGNKTDQKGLRMVEKTRGESIARQLGMKFIETSALTGDGVNELFDLLVKDIYSSLLIENNPEEKNPKNLNVINVTDRIRKCC